MRILVTGGAGQVGRELQRLDWPDSVALSAPARDRLDITDEASVRRALDGVDGVINCAAYTAVDKAESDSVEAWRVNALGPAILAAATARAGVPIVHVSTDYVFDGLADRPYVETDAVRPLNVYGASKEGGEQAIRAGNPRHAIIRASWIVSAHRSNFLKTMLRLGRERAILRIVDDQIGRPTAASDLAAALATIAQRLIADASTPAGIWHFANAGDTSWFGFAEDIFAQARRYSLRTPAVEPISTQDYPTPARRPPNSRLDTSRIEADFGVIPQSWRRAILPIIAELADAEGDKRDRAA